MRDVDGPVDGTCVEWRLEEGWGVLRPDDGDLRVWCHFSNVEMDGFKELHPGDKVRFAYEVPGQDGYPARAVDGVMVLG